MAPLRIAVEWGFGKIVSLWPFLDYRKKHQVLLSPIGLYFGVAHGVHRAGAGVGVVGSIFSGSPRLRRTSRTMWARTLGSS